MRHKITTMLDFEITFDQDAKRLLVLEKAADGTRIIEPQDYEYLPQSIDVARHGDAHPSREAKAAIDMFAIAFYLVGELKIPYHEVCAEFSKIPEFEAFRISRLVHMQPEDRTALRERLEAAGEPKIAQLI